MHFNYLFSFFIRPIELILEFIFSSVYKLTGNIGVSIIFVGIIMNILILPVYLRADKITKDNSQKKLRIKPWISKINSAFKGDERFMILQALYRENHYSPLSILLDSLPILFEVPFFIAGFHLLSNLNIVKGVSFLFIKDLGQPDNLFNIGSLPVNILPILMTAINLLSNLIYSKKQSTGTKVQGYVLAALFLVLLYDSPSCLVLYWTTNNLFSLVKNIVLEAVIPLFPRKDLHVRRPGVFDYKVRKYDHLFVVLGLFFVSYLTGVIVSSDVIKSNTQTFMDPFNLINPNLYVLNAFCIASGMYLFWGSVIYVMIPDRAKKIMQFLLIIYSTVCMVDYFGFNANGILNRQLVLTLYEDDSYKIPINILVILMICILFYILFRNNRSFAYTFLLIETITLSVFGFMNIVKIQNDYNDSLYVNDIVGINEVSFSKNGQNVVVIMLDKGLGSLVPYILNEDPSLAEDYDGFTFYPNTLSYGIVTAVGAPSLFGGYEYTPEKINARNTELLRDKHDESLLVMPVIFSQNDYNVTVCDPSLAGYRWIPDYRIYDDYPDINVYSFQGVFNDSIDGVRNFPVYERNFFCYGFSRLAPMFLRDIFYDDSIFNSAEREFFYEYVQIPTGEDSARGYSVDFLDSYTSISALSDITNVTDSDENNFLMLTCNSVHDSCILSEPSYLPELVVDNTEFDLNNTSRFIIDNNRLLLSNTYQYGFYQSFMCTLRTLADWFDELRANGCYDNTRIIIVADHGSDNFGDSIYAGVDANCFNPVLMVKDFDSHGFTIDPTIMTNAETCFLAFDQLIDNPVNPITGNQMVSELQNGHFLVMFNYDSIFDQIFDINTFTEGDWYEVDGDVMNPDSWTHLGTW